jgi:hypothetical protein
MSGLVDGCRLGTHSASEGISWLAGRPIYTQDLATGFLGLDKIVLWFADLPVTLWLILILPMIWGWTWAWIIKHHNFRQTETG